jgi:hypothetical protein
MEDSNVVLIPLTHASFLPTRVLRSLPLECSTLISLIPYLFSLLISIYFSSAPFEYLASEIVSREGWPRQLG